MTDIAPRPKTTTLFNPGVTPEACDILFSRWDPSSLAALSTNPFRCGKYRITARSTIKRPFKSSSSVFECVSFHWERKETSVTVTDLAGHTHTILRSVHLTSDWNVNRFARYNRFWSVSWTQNSLSWCCRSTNLLKLKVQMFVFRRIAENWPWRTIRWKTGKSVWKVDDTELKWIGNCLDWYKENYQMSQNFTLNTVTVTF